MIDFASIARRIKEERRMNKRVSQEVMAADLGIYQADVSNLERANKGSGINDLYRLDKIAGYFGIPTQQLIFGMSEKDAMMKYTSTPEKLTRLEYKTEIPESNAVFLGNAFKANFKKMVLDAFRYGPYSTYFVTVMNQIPNGLEFEEGKPQDFVLRRLHGYTFYNDRVIASMTVSEHNVFHFMNQPILGMLQQFLIPTKVIDVVDIARLINPYLPLMYMGEESKRDEYQEKYFDRLMELRQINDKPVLLIQSLYVKEDCRQNGIAKMMIDALSSMYEDPMLWLNMQPTDEEELERGMMLSPECSNFEYGQMTLNAHIAERLGFTVDPELWHLTMSFTNERGFAEYKEVEALKSAFKLPKHIQDIIKDDEDLVQIGRARQKLLQSSEQPTSKMKVITINDSTTLEIVCPICGEKIVSKELGLQMCPHVLFHAGFEGIEYVRKDLPWTFGERPIDEPLKDGDVEWEEDMSMYDYIAKLDYPGAFCYAIDAPEPFNFTGYIGFSED